MKLKILTAEVDDAAAISSLIINTAASQLRAEFSDQGWELFLKLLSEETQKSLIKNKKFNYRIAVRESIDTGDKVIMGILARKDINHLFHLFVNPDYQGQGVATGLWLDCLGNITSDRNSIIKKKQPFDKITLNSSDFGLQFYLKLGFVMESGRQMKNGVCYTPMFYSLSAS